MACLEPRADLAVRKAVDSYLEGRLDPQCRGEVIFETRNSRYRMQDGALVEAPNSSLLGAEFVGWLLESAPGPQVQFTWVTGCRAILLNRNRGRHLVVTSSTWSCATSENRRDGSAVIQSGSAHHPSTHPPPSPRHAMAPPAHPREARFVPMAPATPTTEWPLTTAPSAKSSSAPPAPCLDAFAAPRPASSRPGVETDSLYSAYASPLMRIPLPPPIPAFPPMAADRPARRAAAIHLPSRPLGAGAQGQRRLPWPASPSRRDDAPSAPSSDVRELAAPRDEAASEDACSFLAHAHPGDADAADADLAPAQPKHRSFLRARPMNLRLNTAPQPQPPQPQADVSAVRRGARLR